MPKGRLRFSHSLQLRLSIVFLSLVALVGLSLSLLGYNSTVWVLENTTEQVLKQVTQYSTAQAELQFTPAETAANMLASAATVTQVTEETRLESIPLMVQALRSSPDITSVFVGNGEGDFILVRRQLWDSVNIGQFRPPAGTAYVAQRLERQEGQPAVGEFLYLSINLDILDRRDRPSYQDYDHRTRSWYQSALKRDRLIQTDPYLFFTTNEVGTTIARRSKIGDGSDEVVIGVDITLKTLSDTMRNSKITPNSASMLLSKDKLITAHVDWENAIIRGPGGSPVLRHISMMPGPKIDTALEQFLAGEGDRYRVVDLDGKEWRAIFGRIRFQSGDGYILVITIPEEEIVAGANALLKQGVVWFISLMLAALAIGFLVTEAVTKPLKALQIQTEALRRFEFNVKSEVKTTVSDIQNLAVAVDMMQTTISRFLDISAAIAAEEDFETLLHRLLDEFIATTQTEGGILYLTNPEGTRLVPYVARLDHGREILFPVPDVLLTDKESLVVRSTEDEMAESCVANEEALKQIGVNGIERLFDERPNNLLAAPLYNRQKELVGVLLLFERDEIDPALVRFTEALSGSAAVAIEARQLIAAQKDLFESFIQMTAGAIDAKSAYTGGHCARVPDLTKMLAAAADKAEEGPFRDFSLTPDDWEAIHVASWLHDCGKVTTPEFVVDKATKLETIYDRIHEIRMRVEVMKREAEIAYLKDIMGNGDTPERKAQLDAHLAELDADFAFVAECNVGGEFMSDENIERIQEIARKTWTRTLDDRLGVSHEELERINRTPARTLPTAEPLLSDRKEHLFDRPESQRIEPDNQWGFKMDIPEMLYNRGEVYNLSIRRGTLTAEDRYKINEHIVQTIIMLNQLPFPKHLKSVPELAGGHHEKMDGTGYPLRLSKSDMSPMARMMAIADIFEALTANDRPYKKGKTLSQALRIMTFMAKDQHIDVDLYDLFLVEGVYLEYAKKFLEPEMIDEVNPEDFRLKPSGEAA